ncbi:AAA family ATPase [Streptomyces daghestanicus]|nr:AAA family ATPase [Streptomyces daghestanicus]
MARKLNTVIDATNVEQGVRVELVMAAKRHGMPTVVVVVATPLPVCLERQGRRPDNRRVLEDVVRAQHQAMVHSHQRLAAEGFNTVVFASALYRLEPFLRPWTTWTQPGCVLPFGTVPMCGASRSQVPVVTRPRTRVEKLSRASGPKGRLR